MAMYDEQFKRSVVQTYESSGQGFKAVARRYGLDYATVRRKVAMEKRTQASQTNET